MSGEQLMARLVADNLQGQGLPMVLPGDSTAKREFPVVAVRATKGQADPPHTSNFQWEVRIVARGRDEDQLSEISAIVESITTEQIQEALAIHDEFRVFCVTNDGGEPADSERTRSFTARFSVWASDLRHSSAA